MDSGRTQRPTSAADEGPVTRSESSRAADEPVTAKLSAIPQPREHAVLYVGRRAEGARRRTIRRPLVVGSAGDADVQLVDPAVSRAHLRISPSPRGVLVEDLGSRNGTYVGGVRVTRAEISG